MTAFDIIKAFTNDQEWEKISITDKRKNFFLINRFMSIQFPLQSNGFNHTKIDPASSVDWWRGFIKNKYKTCPTFIYTSTKKNKDKEKKKELPEIVTSFLCEKYEISKREIEEINNFFPVEFYKYCKKVEEMIS